MRENVDSLILMPDKVRHKLNKRLFTLLLWKRQLEAMNRVTLYYFLNGGLNIVDIQTK